MQLDSDDGSAVRVDKQSTSHTAARTPTRTRATMFWRWQLGDVLAVGLVTLMMTVAILALIGLYARRLWALPTHRSSD
eukprot:SAG22_NODE_3500_length_1679_cov_1.922152_2_plen_78_part_00